MAKQLQMNKEIVIVMNLLWNFPAYVVCSKAFVAYAKTPLWRLEYIAMCRGKTKVAVMETILHAYEH
jgi:hypothetical protein